MSIRINTNIEAMNAERNLSITSDAFAKSVERLSSGLRINRAADDAAGLTISEKLQGQVNGLNQAVRNAQDGISLIQTAEGALNETHSILQRMRELAVQGANDTLTGSDRQAIKTEMDQLSAEVDRIANTTQFNTKNLLDGSLAKTASASAVGTNLTGLNANGSNVTVTAGSSTQSGVGTITVTHAATQASIGGTGMTFTAGTAGTLTINGVAISIAATDQNTDVATKINNVANQTGVYASTGSGTLTLLSGTSSTAQYKGSAYSIQISTTAAANLTAWGLEGAGNTATVAATNGTDAVATITGITGESTVTAKGNVLTTNTGMTVDLSAMTATGDISSNNTLTVAVTAGGTANFQIGANSGQTLGLSINNMGATALNVSNLDVSSNAAINQANTGTLARIDNAIASVSSQRSYLGAIQNRLEHTISNLSVASENLTASDSRIKDVDLASEMVNFTKDQILQQAGTAILAQANQAPQSVLQLLR